jgi:hypothetical protein
MDVRGVRATQHGTDLVKLMTLLLELPNGQQIRVNSEDVRRKPIKLTAIKPNGDEKEYRISVTQNEKVIMN